MTRWRRASFRAAASRCCAPARASRISTPPTRTRTRAFASCSARSRTGLQNAASIAGLILTTDCMIAQRPERREPSQAALGEDLAA